MLALLPVLLAAPLALAAPSTMAARQILYPECEGLLPFEITNFVSVEAPAGSGIASSVSFTLTNPNKGGDIPRQCVVSYPDGGSVTNSNTHPCEASGSYFLYTGPEQLVALQPMECGHEGPDVVATGSGTVPLQCTIVDPEGPVTCVQDGDGELPIIGAY